MNTTNGNSKLKNKIRQNIDRLCCIIEKEPKIFISHAGEIILCEKAKKLISSKNINASELFPWLKIGIKHLAEMSFHGINMMMLQFPCNSHKADVVVILRENNTHKKLPDITKTERNVLKYLVKGFSNKDIAFRLNVEAGTINAHLDNIYRKLKVSNRVSAACVAISNGIVVQE